METITLKRSGERPLTFTGEEVASASTSMNNAHPAYSGETGICHEARIYRTDTQVYVLEFVTHSAWQGSLDTREALVFDGVENLLDYIEVELPRRVKDPLLAELGGHVDIAERL